MSYELWALAFSECRELGMLFSEAAVLSIILIASAVIVGLFEAWLLGKS